MQEEGNEPDSVMLRNTTLFAVTGGGKAIQGLAAHDGTFLWDQTAAAKSKVSNRQSPSLSLRARMLPVGRDVDGDGDEDVAVLSGDGRLTMRSLGEGTASWRADVSLELPETSIQHMSESGNGILVVGSQEPGSLPAAVNVSASDGRVLSSGVVSGGCKMGTKETGGLALVHDDQAWWLVIACHEESRLKGVSVSDVLSGRSPTMTTVDASELRSIGDIERVERAGSSGQAALVRGAQASALVRLSRGGQAVKLLRVVAKGSVVSDDDFSLSDGSRAVVVGGSSSTSASGGGHVLSVVSLSSGELHHEEHFNGLNEGGDSLRRIFPSTYTRPDGKSVGFRFIVSTDSGKVALVQQGMVVWEKEEGLASVHSAIFSDIPRKGLADTSIQSEGLPWLQTLRMHLLTVKQNFFANLMSAREREELGELKRNALFAGEWERDRYGFRKLAIVLTETNLVAAINTQTGSIAWRRYFSGPRFRHIVKAPTDRDEQALLLGPAPERSGESRGLVISCHTGEVVRDARMEYEVDHVLEPGKRHEKGGFRIMVDTEGRGHAFPPESEEQADEQVQQGAHYHVVDPERNSAWGRALQGSHGTYNGSETWRVAFDANVVKIVAYAASSRADNPSSAVRVPGDRSIMYKHSNPNVILIATASQEEQYVEAKLLDSVSGRILYRARHKGAQPPVHVALADNWAVYHYWDAEAKRNAISVLELYDESGKRHVESWAARAALARATGGGSAALSLAAPEGSSLQQPQLRVLGQSYFIPHSVKSLSVTQSRFGVVGKQILVATHSDQVFTLDKKLLDPRRPSLKPTNADRDEGLLPYSEYLPVPATSFLARASRARRIRGMSISPADVESTCLVLAYGLDILLSRASPGRSFDMLGDDFSFPLLLLTIVGLSVLAILLGFLVHRKETKRLWQ